MNLDSIQEVKIEITKEEENAIIDVINLFDNILEEEECDGELVTNFIKRYTFVHADVDLYEVKSTLEDILQAFTQYKLELANKKKEKRWATKNE